MVEDGKHDRMHERTDCQAKSFPDLKVASVSGVQTVDIT